MFASHHHAVSPQRNYRRRLQSLRDRHQERDGAKPFQEIDDGLGLPMQVEGIQMPFVALLREAAELGQVE